MPRDHDEVRAVLEACAGAGVAVVPFGGGTSVVGGVEPLRERLRRARLARPRGARRARVVSTSARSWRWWAAGCAPSSSRRRLGERGFTLGHYPQSYEYVTIGGCAATRSAGQASTGLRAHRRPRGRGAPRGAGRRPRPARAAGERRGPRAAPARRRLGGRAGRDHAGRAAGAPGARAQPLRGLDVRELRRGRRGAAAPGAGRRGARRGAALRRGRDAAGLRHGRPARRARGARCGPTCAPAAWPAARWPSSAGRARRRPVRVRREAAVEALRDAGGVALGQPAGRAWVRSRFHGPYLRDELMDRGVLVETLETATTWAQLFTLYRAVGDALREPRAARRLPHLAPLSDGRVAVLHLHGAGAPRRGARAVGARSRRRRARRSSRPAATITHHHAVGPRPRAVHGRRGRRHRGGRAARAQARARSGRGHEPRQAAAVGLAAGGALDGPAQVDRARRGRVAARLARDTRTPCSWRC